MEMEFEWDPSKAASNLKKHNIDFIDAITIFRDPARKEADVTKLEHGEQRWKAIGMMHDGRMATVVYTDRGDPDSTTVRRIISARKVRKNERQEYDKG